MSIIIDIVIIGIILLCLFMGYRKGLIGLAFSIVSFVAALAIALILFVPISSLIIDNTEFDNNIKNAIVSNFNKSQEETVVAEAESETSTVENTENDTNFITQYIDEQIDEAAGNTLDVVATEISEVCIKGLVFIALFIVVKIALIFFKVIANFIAKLPLLKQFNKLGGVVFGLLKGLVITYGILAVLLLVSPMFNETEFYKAIDDSLVGSIMYENNIIIKIIF